MQNTTLAIRTRQLTRRYKQVTAVDGLDLAVQRGEIYGFLGANGAGKTTTMKMLVGLLQPDAGHVWIDGYDMWSESASLAAKAALGYVGDRAKQRHGVAVHTSRCAHWRSDGPRVCGLLGASARKPA